MISFPNDYLKFAEKYSEILNAKYPEIEINIKFISSDDENRLVNCIDSPFCISRVETNQHYQIAYNEQIIMSAELDEEEIMAMISHEIGHRIILDTHIDNTQNEEEKILKEIACDKISVELGLRESMISGLSKIREMVEEKMYNERMSSLLNIRY